jgi:hypothetical protein
MARGRVQIWEWRLGVVAEVAEEAAGGTLREVNGKEIIELDDPKVTTPATFGG